MFEPRTFGNPPHSDRRLFNCQAWRDAYDATGQLLPARYGPPRPHFFRAISGEEVADLVFEFCTHPTHTILSIGEIHAGANWEHDHYCTVIYQAFLPNGNSTADDEE